MQLKDIPLSGGDQRTEDRFGVPPLGGSGLEMTPTCGTLGAEPPEAKGGTPNPNLEVGLK
jgi:hypothetical protein